MQIRVDGKGVQKVTFTKPELVAVRKVLQFATAIPKGLWFEAELDALQDAAAKFLQTVERSEQDPPY